MSKEKLKDSRDKHKLLMMIAAFAAVYVIWGSTYSPQYAIANESRHSMASEITIAGANRYGIARLSRVTKSRSWLGEQPDRWNSLLAIETVRGAGRALYFIKPRGSARRHATLSDRDAGMDIHGHRASEH